MSQTQQEKEEKSERVETAEAKKRRFLKYGIVGIVAALAGSQLPIPKALASNSPPSAVFEAGSGVEPASWIVYPYDGNYYRKSGWSGEVTENANAAVTINAALTALA